jgi:ADP-heptose:LPS heptosyltransferase
VRILLLCLDNLGDLVFSSTLVAPLKALYPEASWAVFCKAYAQDIAGAFPVPATIIAADPPWDGAPGRTPGSYRDFVSAITVARRWRPDVVLVATKNWRAAATAFVIGGRLRVGFTSPKARLFLTHGISRDGWDQTPVTTMLIKLLGPLGVTHTDEFSPPVSLHLSPDASTGVTIPPCSFVVLHPFAGDMSRCWPLKEWGTLAAKIRAAGYGVVWMGRADEARHIGEQIHEVRDDFFMWQLGRSQLSSTLAVTARARALVGHDSGPIHFAAALGTPVLGLYLPGDYPRTVCRGPGPHHVIWRPSPSMLHCGEVWERLCQILQQQNRDADS